MAAVRVSRRGRGDLGLSFGGDGMDKDPGDGGGRGRKIF